MNWWNSIIRMGLSYEATEQCARFLIVRVQCKAAKKCMEATSVLLTSKILEQVLDSRSKATLFFFPTFPLLKNNYYIKFSHCQLFSQSFFPPYLLLINFCQCLVSYCSFFFIEQYMHQSLSLENSDSISLSHAADIFPPLTSLLYCPRSNSFLELITNKIMNSEYIIVDVMTNSRNAFSFFFFFL